MILYTLTLAARNQEQSLEVGEQEPRQDRQTQRLNLADSFNAFSGRYRHSVPSKEAASPRELQTDSKEPNGLLKSSHTGI